jgi:hypothetical protein
VSSDISLRIYSIGKNLKVRALLGIAKFTAVMAVLLLAGNAYATLIDSFDVGYTTPVLLVYPPATFLPGTALDMKSGATSDIIGGTRDTELDYVSGPGISYSTANLGSSGSLDFAQGPNSSAKLTLIWDGDTSQGLTSYSLGANLTSGGATGLVTDVKNIDIDLTYMVEIYTDSTHASVYSGIIPGGTSGPLYVDFNSQFTVKPGASGGANFSNVGAIKLVLDGNHPDADISINSLGTAVPEPATFVLMLSGLMGLGFHVYRRRGK